jgi:dCTP deaminase
MLPGSGSLAGMLLSDRDIKVELSNGRIGLEPLDLEMVQPSSVDVRLDQYFRLFDNHKYPFIDPAEDQPELTRLVEAKPGEPFILHPGEFVLGSTYERVSLPDDIAARLEGKSSLGRLGLLTHSTAGFVDPGFTGHVTLELSNVATLPIKLWPGMKIGQLCFMRLTSPTAVRLERVLVALSGSARTYGVALTPELSPHTDRARRHHRGRELTP